MRGEMSDLANELRALCADECRNRIDYRCVICRGADAVERLAAAEARIEELCVEREVYREAGVNLSRTACREDIDTEASRIMEQRGETWGEHLSEQGSR